MVLSILGWGRDLDGDQRMIERLWHTPGGVDVVPLDVDGDGAKELVPLDRDVASGRAAPVLLKVDAAGWWRLAPYEIGALAGLPEALFDRPGDIHQSVPAMLELVRKRGVKPRDVAALQRKIMARLATHEAAPDTYIHAWEGLFSAMAWPGNEQAYEVLLPYLGVPRAAEFVMEALLELDAQTGQTRGREGLLVWLKGALEDRTRDEDTRALLYAMEARGIKEGAAAVVARFMTPQGTFSDERLLFFMGALSSQRDALWPLWDDAQQREAFGARLMGVMYWPPQLFPNSKRWREAVSAAALRGLMARREVERYAMVWAIYSGDATLHEEVWARVERSEDPEYRAAVWQFMGGQGVPLPSSPRVVRWMKRAQADERSALWGWVMKVGDAEAILPLLEHVETPQALGALRRTLWAPGRPCEGPFPDIAPCMGVTTAMFEALPKLHGYLAAHIAGGDEAMRKAAVFVMGVMPHEPSQRLLLTLASEARGELAGVARAALTEGGYALAQDYLFEQVRAAPTERFYFEGLSRAMGAETAQRLLDWLAGYDVGGPTRFHGTWAIAKAAPRVCAARLELLDQQVEAVSTPCEQRVAAAVALALCEPARLERLASDALRGECRGGVIEAPLREVGERGGAAQLPVLDRLAQDQRSRQVRDGAMRAAAAIRAR
jgi:hypothetical protein